MLKRGILGYKIYDASLLRINKNSSTSIQGEQGQV